MRVDAIVAGGCAASYVGTAAWAALGSDLAAPFPAIVSVKDALIAGVCVAWAVAEHRAGERRARGIALAVALIILADALLALAVGVSPWRTDVAPSGSAAGAIGVGVGLVAAGLALVWFARRPDPRPA